MTTINARRLLAAALCTGLFAAVAAHAMPRTQRAFSARYPAAADSLGRCGTCHLEAPSLNRYGTALKLVSLDFAKIDSLDSDGDGWSNAEEIKLLTYPGDSLSQPPRKAKPAAAKPAPAKSKK